MSFFIRKLVYSLLGRKKRGKHDDQSGTIAGAVIFGALLFAAAKLQAHSTAAARRDETSTVCGPCAFLQIHFCAGKKRTSKCF